MVKGVKLIQGRDRQGTLGASLQKLLEEKLLAKRVPRIKVVFWVLQLGLIHPVVNKIGGEFLDGIHKRQVVRGLYGEHARLDEPCLPVDAGDLVRLVSELVFEELAEVLRGDGARCKGIHVLTEEGQECGLTHTLLEVEKQMHALLIGNRREGVVGVHTLQGRDKAGEFMVGAVVRHTALEGLEAQRRPQVEVPFVPSYLGHDGLLEPLGPTLIQPKVGPRGVSHKVASP
mmetsp:Transcript_32909/g.95266  ORF Transcript_32909/g.95266 Transcript_32909/m.95266 type:complete len:230 (+) Transcript_32909:455-1144(+)